MVLYGKPPPLLNWTFAWFSLLRSSFIVWPTGRLVLSLYHSKLYEKKPKMVGKWDSKQKRFQFSTSGFEVLPFKSILEKLFASVLKLLSTVIAIQFAENMHFGGKWDLIRALVVLSKLFFSDSFLSFTDSQGINFDPLVKNAYTICKS